MDYALSPRRDDAAVGRGLFVAGARGDATDDHHLVRSDAGGGSLSPRAVKSFLCHAALAGQYGEQLAAPFLRGDRTWHQDDQSVRVPAGAGGVYGESHVVTRDVCR